MRLQDSGAEGELPTIKGYGALYYQAGKPSTEFAPFSEVRLRIHPGAFARAIGGKDDVRGLFNHDPNKVLGRMSAGTLKLSEDKRGLLYEITPPDTEVGRGLVASIRRGDVSGSSIGFNSLSEEWAKEKGLRVLNITEIELFDVSPVTFPAFEATTARVAADAESAIQASLHAWERELARGANCGRQRRLDALALECGA